VALLQPGLAEEAALEDAQGFARGRPQRREVRQEAGGSLGQGDGSLVGPARQVDFHGTGGGFDPVPDPIRLPLSGTGGRGAHLRHLPLLRFVLPHHAGGGPEQRYGTDRPARQQED